jgi:hypothetical protein
MTESTEITSSGTYFSDALLSVAKFPGVRIHRAAYLRSALGAHCAAEIVEQAIATSPADAGVGLDLLVKAADDSIRLETIKVTAISTAAGLPGGFAMIAAVPADAAQMLAHMLRVAQKLAYLYSWPELFSDDGVEPDDATQSLLTLFIGVMFGATAAGEAVQKVSVKVAEQAVKQLPKRALTQGVIYPIVKTVAGHIGIKMTKDTFAKGIGKVIPLVGGVLSGGLTLATFLPMSNRLKRHLAGLPTAVPRVA